MGWAGVHLFSSLKALGKAHLTEVSTGEKQSVPFTLIKGVQLVCPHPCCRLWGGNSWIREEGRRKGESGEQGWWMKDQAPIHRYCRGATAGSQRLCPHFAFCRERVQPP